MKFEVKEQREQTAHEKRMAFISMCKLYHSCDTWSEFVLKRSIEFGILSKINIFDKFWLYYMSTNHGISLCSFVFSTMIAFIVGICMFSITLISDMPIGIVTIMSVSAYALSYAFFVNFLEYVKHEINYYV